MNRFSLLLLAGVASVAFASSASAADLIIDTPSYPGVVDVGGSWEGPYIGVFAGYGWGLADDDAAQGGFGMATGGNDIDIAGWQVGLAAGANFYLTDKVVGGIVGDIAWSNVTGEIDPTLPGLSPLYTGSTHSIKWQGSVRGLIGLDAGAFMPYLTGGLAVAYGERYSPIGATETVNATHIGWTVGAGAKVAITEDVSLDLLYRYSDFGTATYDWAAPAATDREVNLTQHALTVGLNWSF